MKLNATTVTHGHIAAEKEVLHTTTANRHRFHLLDALRGIAAFLVLLYHIPSFICSIGSQSAFLAVDFFFCLSGFVIAFSYEKRLLATFSLKDFFAARVIRLYPTYLLGTLLGLCVFLTNLPHPLTAVLKCRLLALILVQIAMLPNIHIWHSLNLFPLDPPGWSLFYELFANLAFAFLLRKKMASSWALAIFALCASILLARSAFRGEQLGFGWANNWHHFYLGIARVTLSFSAGVLILRLFHRLKHPMLSQTLQWIVPSALAAALIFLLLSPITALQTPVFQLLTIILFFPALVFMGSLTTTPASWTKLCVFLGNISYPVYLLQGVFLDLLYKPRVMEFAAAHPKFVFASLILLLTAVSHLAVKLYDSPVRSRLTRYYNAKGSVSTPAVE